MVISEEQEKHFSKLKCKMEKTAYIRFNLAERITRDERLSVLFSSVLTIYLICSSVALFASQNLSSSTLGQTVSLISIAASVSLLVVNLFDSAEQRTLCAREMRGSAQRLLSIASSIDIELKSATPDLTALKKSAMEYHDAIDRFGRNHQSWDNDLYEALEGMRHGTFWDWCLNFAKHKKLWAIRFISDWWLHLIILGICSSGFYLLCLHALSTLDILGNKN